MTTATSPQLNAPTRSREEYLSEKIGSGQPMSQAEMHEWLTMDKTVPFGRQADFVEPDLRGSAAISTTWLFHRFNLAQQAGRK